MQKQQQNHSSFTFLKYWQLNPDQNFTLGLFFWLCLSLSICSLPFLAFTVYLIQGLYVIGCFIFIFLLYLSFHFYQFKSFKNNFNQLKSSILGLEDLKLVMIDSNIENWYKVKIVFNAWQDEEIIRVAKKLTLITKSCYYTIDDASPNFAEEWTTTRDKACSGWINRNAAAQIWFFINKQKNHIDNISSISISVNFNDVKNIKHQSYTGD